MVTLPPKQERFCLEYVVDCSPREAAIRTGYKEKRASSAALKLMAKPDIVERIAELQHELQVKLGVTREQVVQELAKLAFTDLTDVVDFTGANIRIRSPLEIDPQVLGAISEISEKDTGFRIERRVKMHDKKGALDSLAKHLGMFTDKVEHSGPSGGPIDNKFFVEFVKYKPPLGE